MNPIELTEFQRVVHVTEPNLEDGATPAAHRLPRRRGEAQREQHRPDLGSERLMGRGEARHTLQNRAICLEQTTQERAVHSRVVGFQDGGRDPRHPALAGVIIAGQVPWRTRRLPPASEPDGLQGQLLVALLRGDHRLKAEEILGENAQAVSDVEVSVRDAQPDAFGVQAAIAHEVAHKLGQLGGDGVGHVHMTVTGVISLVEDRQRHLAGLADQRAQLHRDQVPGRRCQPTASTPTSRSSHRPP